MLNFLGKVRKLEIVDLCGMQRLSDESLIGLCKLNPQLLSLNLTWCLALTDKAFTDGLSKLVKGMTLLSVFGNTNLTQVSLDALSSH